MSPEETQLLKSLFDRVKSASSTPRDAEAEALIGQAIREEPASPYYLAQAVIVQEKGLEAAAAHIRQLEERIHQLETSGADSHPTQQGGFMSSIFGTNQQQAPAPVQAQAPTQTYRNDTAGQTPGPWGRAPDAQQANPQFSQQPAGLARPAGGGFLQGALGAAAGVAGGMLLANSLSGIFSNHVASSGWGSPFGGSGSGNAPVEETVVNNYYGDSSRQQDADNNNDDLQQADYSDSNDDGDFDSGDGDSSA